MEFERDVIGNTNEILVTHKRLVQLDAQSLLSREVPSHLNSHFQFEDDSFEASRAMALREHPDLDLDMEMELYEFIDDLRGVNERLNLNMPESPRLRDERSVCDQKLEEEFQNFELDSTFISYKDERGAHLDHSHDCTQLEDQELYEFGNTTFQSFRQHSKAHHRSRLFSEVLLPATTSVAAEQSKKVA